MSRSQKVLVYGGLALVVWGLAYGLFYAVFVEHQTLDRMGGSLTQSFVYAAERNPSEFARSHGQYVEASYVYVRQVDAHSHWLGLAVLLIVLGAAFGHLNLDARTRQFCAWILLAGACLFPLGVLLETWNPGPAPKAIAVLGSALVVLGLVIATWGFARPVARS